MLSFIILIILAVIIVIFSALFAGAETGIYQLSWLRLRLGVEQKKRLFVLLGKTMRDSTGLLLSILIGNNLTHYLTTSIVTYLLLRHFNVEHTAEIFATIITTPVLFVFGELVPKNVFYYRSDKLMPLCSPVLIVLYKSLHFCGIVPLLKLFSKVIYRFAAEPQPAKSIITPVRRHHIRAILQETREEGVLSAVQTDIINRVVSIPTVKLAEVMTPLSVVNSVPYDSDRPLLLETLEKHPHTRLPVYKGRLDNIVGYINIYETLSSPQRFDNLGDFITPVYPLGAQTTVTETIDTMQSRKIPMVLVTRKTHANKSRPVGIVTMKDLVEELIGELAEW